MPSTPAPSAPAYAALSVAGRVREHNEDALLCSSTLGLWAVADGMGGHQCGEVASATALAALEQHIQAGADLPTAVHGANEAVLAVAAEGGEERRGMGTTLVALHLQGDAYQLAWAGDSRCYLIDASGIRQISHDHSWVQMLVDLGQLTPEQARQDPRRNVVTQCLGRDDQALEVGSLVGRLAPGELLLLCSDGLSNELDDATLHQVCSRSSTLEAMVGTLVELANCHGGRDNISCIVLGLSAPESAPPEAPPRRFLSRWFGPRKQR